MKKNILMGVGAAALTIGAVFATNAANKRLVTTAYYQSGSNCYSVTLQASQFTTTGTTNQASIKTQGGSNKLLVANRTNPSTCGSTAIFFNP